jgi:FtsZ-binding cell division protein ZapB
MSSRYGRDKRRRAREQIEALSRRVDDQAETIRMDRALLRRQSEQLAGMRERMMDWDQRIRAMLGPYTSAGIDDTTFRVDSLDEISQMAIMPRLDPMMFLRGDQAAESDVASYVENILVVIGSLREDSRMRLARESAFDVVLRGHHRVASAYYGMSESYFRELRRAGEDGVAILVRKIAPQIAQLLLADTKSQRGAA